jgi:transitional endoplasmic reticulum ATPase
MQSTTDEFIVAAGAWSQSLHSEIWVYDNSFWDKDHGLWAEVQKANWDDVILKDEFKQDLKNDIYGFYSQEKVYKVLSLIQELEAQLTIGIGITNSLETRNDLPW